MLKYKQYVHDFNFFLQNDTCFLQLQCPEKKRIDKLAYKNKLRKLWILGIIPDLLAISLCDQQRQTSLKITPVVSDLLI